ncbi:hypothetical protein HNP49_000074 [Pseudomonas fluvialis]|uniref:Uncharacterized protein n=1 Tax=Pseudomonas fluvialis TaxID=1793966 RepID=A0A7X0BNI8_9PSED|nr:hypothetical protein [Pseudomonas fluvialis]MBB6339924.1 hypothetical protein [Pseudomonas fluvialis]
MSSLIRNGSLGALLLLAGQAVAQGDSAALLTSLEQQQLASYRLQTLFHLHSIQEGAENVGGQLKAESASFLTQLEQLDEQASGLGLETEIKAVQDEGRKFAGIVATDELLEQGYVDLHTVNDLSASQHALREGYQRLEEQLASKGVKGNPLQDQAILMQRIAAEYVRESASLDGGSAIYDNAQDLEKPVDQLAQEFRQQLASLDQQYAGQAQVSQKLKKVGITFAYIEKSLQNYKERSVPYVVSRYSDKIVVSLTASN